MTSKYCYTCGHLLGVTRHVSHYDGATGKPEFYEVYSCPAKKWYQLDHYFTETDAFVYFG